MTPKEQSRRALEKGGPRSLRRPACAADASARHHQSESHALHLEYTRARSNHGQDNH